MEEGNVMELKYNIRDARREDIPKLLEIYRYYVEETPVSFEYELPSQSEFETRLETITRKFPYLVIEYKEVIVGYAYASVFKGRAAYDWSVETTIYISKDYKDQGAGKTLYTQLERCLQKQNILNMNACITYGNPKSMEFHKKMGYEQVAHFHKCGYKFGQWYDMVWFEKIIGEHQENMPAIVPYKELP